MKKFIPALLALIFILDGCGSSKKQLEQGNYEAALSQAVRQLRKDPKDSKQAATLDRAYTILNDQDKERVRFLKLEAKASNWDEIYQVNKRMSDRQALVRTILPLQLNGSSIDYPYVDYMPEMINAKRKSADFYFNHGNELMKTKLRESYRQAFYEFVRAKEYIGDYEGIDNKIDESKYLGMTRVLISLANRSAVQFPADFEEDLLAIDLPRLNSEWVEYHTKDLDANLQYDYLVNITIRNIGISPDQTMQRDSVIKKEVADGFTYKLDNKGNVVKDTLGNDIKLPKFKTLQCALIETVQSKTCQINGDMEVIQLLPGKAVVKKEPLGAESDFENISARALGDIQALSPAQVEKTKSKPVPFPDDQEMVVRCSESLKQAINRAVQSNK
ncbi:MAG: hypothetical protein WCE64_09780, partial [Bacteroidales bacterium]